MLVDPWLTGELTFAGQNWAFEACPHTWLVPAPLCQKLRCADRLLFLVPARHQLFINTASKGPRLKASGWFYLQGRKGLDPPLDIDAIAAKANLMLLSQVLSNLAEHSCTSCKSAKD